MTSSIKIVVEEPPDTFVAYPLGPAGIVVGQGDTYEAALADVTSAIRFHIETFGPEVLESDSPILNVALAETRIAVEMPPFPVAAPQRCVVGAFERLGFRIVREREQIAMERENADGTRTPLILPSHPLIKGSTLRTVCTKAGVSRDDFLAAYNQS